MTSIVLKVSYGTEDLTSAWVCYYGIENQCSSKRSFYVFCFIAFTKLEVCLKYVLSILPTSLCPHRFVFAVVFLWCEEMEAQALQADRPEFRVRAGKPGTGWRQADYLPFWDVSFLIYNTIYLLTYREGSVNTYKAKVSPHLFFPVTVVTTDYWNGSRRKGFYGLTMTLFWYDVVYWEVFFPTLELCFKIVM